jgi:hypothetical protein
MKKRLKKKQPQRVADNTSELLILADGRIYAHNITPDIASLLSDLDPGDEPMRERAGTTAVKQHSKA